jgi:hypothetical protein
MAVYSRAVLSACVFLCFAYYQTHRIVGLALALIPLEFCLLPESSCLPEDVIHSSPNTLMDDICAPQMRTRSAQGAGITVLHCHMSVAGMTGDLPGKMVIWQNWACLPEMVRRC